MSWKPAHCSRVAMFCPHADVRRRLAARLRPRIRAVSALERAVARIAPKFLPSGAGYPLIDASLPPPMVPHNFLIRPLLGLALSVPLLGLQGCAVVAVADAAVTVVATGVSITAKTVGAVADAVIPDGDDD